MSVLVLATSSEEQQVFVQALIPHLRGVIETCDPRREELTVSPSTQVVVVEHRVGEVDGLVWIDQLRLQYPELHMVLVVTGGDTRFALQALRRGLADYIPRDQLESLGPVVRDLLLTPWRVARPHRHLEQLGLLASAAAHEFSNILTPLHLGIDLLQRPLSEERRLPVLEAMSQSLQRGTQLMNQVLDFARLQPNECRYVSFEHLLIESLEQHLNDRAIVRQFEENLLPVLGDGVQLRHLCQLLCLHSRQALCTEEPTVFSLRQLGLSPSATPDSTEEPTEFLEWRIVYPPDTFLGETGSVSADSLPALGTAASGLTLLMARDIARRHGGRLDVATQMYQGTSITVRLPVARPPAEGNSGEDSDCG
jgi:signal transduction histidine kinase